MAAPPANSPQYFAALQANGWSAAAANYEMIRGWLELMESIKKRSPESLQSRGDVLIAAIKAYTLLHGGLPRELSDAKALDDDDLIWQYKVEVNEYYLKAHSERYGVSLTYSSGSNEWSVSRADDRPLPSPPAIHRRLVAALETMTADGTRNPDLSCSKTSR